MKIREIIECLSREPGLTVGNPFQSLGSDPRLLEREISSFTSDSRNLGKEDSAFIAIRGEKADGHRYIPDARDRGCLLIGEDFPEATPRLQVSDSRLASALLANEYYGQPSKDMLVLGVTGTSGKTTTTHLLEKILEAEGRKVGLIGTIESRYPGKRITSTHTTPDPWTLQSLLSEMRVAGCNAVVMEVSSHALKQHRVTGVYFDGMIFTNLTPEHLDYHPDLEDYFLSKKSLFVEHAERARKVGKNPVACVHTGDDFGRRLLKEIQGVTASRGFVVPTETRITALGIEGVFSGVSIHSSLLARFNAENIAGAVELCRAVSIPPGDIAKGVASVQGVAGRLERIADKKGRIVLVDYAHKPDALEKVLHTLRPMVQDGNRLITVFGCGGDRDPTKRSVMGEIACRLSDEVILTSDNPRTEDPEKILDAIEVGCRGFKNYKREADRSRAIRQAIESGQKGDLILIAGKGHEDYQIIGSQKHRFDDREEAKRWVD